MQISVTLIIIVITTLISFSAFSNDRLKNDLIFYPPAITRGQWYRLFSCGLIHSDPVHLIFNMLSLYLFGMGQNNSGVEYTFMLIFGEKGRWIYLLMYVLALAVSILPTYFKNKHNYHYRGLGASGAVSAVVFASILFNPTAGMGLFFIRVYIAGFIFGIIYLVSSHLMEKRGGDNINHSAHIFGALFGIAFVWLSCQLIAGFNIFEYFIHQIESMDPRDIIQFGNQ